MVQTIERDELRQKIERGDRFVLLDVLAPEYYDRAHLPGALNLHWDDNEAAFLHQASHLIPDKDAEIVAYCAKPTWPASEKAARALAAHGYTNVRDYSGGKKDWIDAGLPMETPRNHDHEAHAA